MAQKIKIGIIGGGMIAQVCHIPFYLSNPDCEIRAIAENRPSLVNYLTNHYHIKNVVPDYHAILNDPEIDAVVLSAPRPAVGPLTLEILSAGKNLLTEKPMAHSVIQSERLVEAAKNKNLVYAVGFMKRYDPGVIKAKEKFIELMQNQKFGALLFARFYDHSKSTVFAPPLHQRPLESRADRFETWPLAPDWLPEKFKQHFAWFINVASHDVNLIHYFFDTNLKIMSSVISMNSSVAAILKHQDTIINLEISKSESGKWVQGAEFIFEKGRLLLEIPSPMDIHGVSRVTLLENDGSGSPSLLETGQGWSFELQAQDFVKVLKTRSAPATSGDDALQEMKLIETIWRKGLEIYSGK